MKPEPKVLAFVAGTPLHELYISVVTLAELRFGIELLSLGNPHRVDLENWLTQTIRPMFDQRVIPVTEDIMFRWRALLEKGRKTGHTFSQPDPIIAAYCRDGSPARAYNSHMRPERFRQSARVCIQSVGAASRVAKRVSFASPP